MIQKRDWWALIFLLCAVPALTQQDQAPKPEAPPEASAPQAGNPRPSTPPPESQPPVPSVQKDHPPEQNPPAPVEETPPANQAHLKARKPASTAKVSSTKKKRSRPAASSKPVAPTSTARDSGGQTGKVVVRNGGARDGRVQLSPGGSQEQELHNRENTAQLLATTDVNLKRISERQLTPSEQSTFDQIQSYVRQARSASDAGDLARAHTLAFKAHLLSDDLANH